MSPGLYWLARLLPPGLAALGAGLLAYVALSVLESAGRGLRRRYGRLRWTPTPTGGELQVGARRVLVTPSRLLPLGLGLGLALLWRTPLFAAWTLLLGGIATGLTQAARPRVTLAGRAQQELFLSALHSRYAVAQSLAAALAGAALDLEDPTAELVLAVSESGRRVRLGLPLPLALRPLAVQGGLLQRLATVLSHAPGAAAAETHALLESLMAAARQQRHRAARAQVTLTVVRLTWRVLVTVNVLAAALSALLPAWRSYYLAHPTPYLLSTALALGGYGYLRFQSQALEDSL